MHLALAQERARNPPGRAPIKIPRGWRRRLAEIKAEKVKQGPRTEKQIARAQKDWTRREHREQTSTRGATKRHT